MTREVTAYSDTVPGDGNNFGRAVRFDATDDDYIGISSGGERVLLTPKQVSALVAFVRAHTRKRAKPRKATR